MNRCSFTQDHHWDPWLRNKGLANYCNFYQLTNTCPVYAVSAIHSQTAKLLHWSHQRTERQPAQRHLSDFFALAHRSLPPPFLRTSEAESVDVRKFHLTCREKWFRARTRPDLDSEPDLGPQRTKRPTAGRRAFESPPLSGRTKPHSQCAREERPFICECVWTEVTGTQAREQRTSQQRTAAPAEMLTVNDDRVSYCIPKLLWMPMPMVQILSFATLIV